MSNQNDYFMKKQNELMELYKIFENFLLLDIYDSRLCQRMMDVTDEATDILRIIMEGQNKGVKNE